MNNKKKSFFYNFFRSFTVLAVAIIFTRADFAYALIPSDMEYGSQWYLKKIGAPAAWDIKRESSQVVIAVLDTGVDISHPDLRDNIWKNKDEIAGNGVDDDRNGYIDDINGWDFVNNIPDPNPKFAEGFTDVGINHGTIIAGIIAARGNNAFGISGVTWQARIMPLKVMNDKGEGSVASVIKAIDYAIKNKADIINLSFVGMGFSRSLEEAIARAYSAGIMIVAAAGNEDNNQASHSLDDLKAYPVCYDGASNMIIGVAAVDAIDQKADFSSYGFSCIDITAPGTSFLGLSVYKPAESYNGEWFNSYYKGYWSGTSMAAPLVSGSLALLKAANPKLKSSQLVETLLSNTDNISRLNPNYLGRLGRGRLNIAAALEEVHNNLISNQYYILTAPQSNSSGSLKVINSDNKTVTSFNAYDNNFKGGTNVAAGDVDGDGIDEIITGAGPGLPAEGGGPHVRIFSQSGELKGQFFAYNNNFRGGVNVAAGDLNQDGIDEIITGAGRGNYGKGPSIRMFKEYKIYNAVYAYGGEIEFGAKVGIIKIKK